MTLCIIGSGLSALTLAKALVNQNINVDLVTLKKSIIYDKTRTLGISKSNVEFFNKEIVNIEKILWKINKIEIFNDNIKKKLINFENKNLQLFSIIKNYQLYKLLSKSLLKNNFFKKIIQKKDEKIDLRNYDLIINTEYSSYLTKKFFSKKIIKKYNSKAFTTIIEHEKIKNNIAIQIFTKNGPLAFLPISEKKTSVVYSFDTSGNAHPNIEEFIYKYNFKYKIKKIQKIDSFELKSINLRSYYNNNILAFGDLLHRIHPLAGQGFNMTIRDTKNLLNIINDKKNLGLSLDSSVFAEFEKKLRHKNLIFSNSVDLVYEFFNLERKFDNNFLTKSVHKLGNYPHINNFLIKVADKGFIN